MAQGWGPDEALDAELRRPGSPLIGAVAYFPERYGARILPIVLECLNGQPVPPALYLEHRLILREGLRFPAPALSLGGIGGTAIPLAS
jgi:ribose transport system substrate-binding protein